MSETGIVPALRTRTVAGAVAGNLTVTGIGLYDKILAVQPLVASVNLASQFTITAANTINNTGGTSSAGQVVLVIWIAAGEGGDLNR